MKPSFRFVALMAWCLGVGTVWFSPASALAQATPAPLTPQPSGVLPFLHPLFSDNAVLQRDRAVPVWGWTTTGALVRLQIGAKTSKATADVTGRWMAYIRPFAAGGPYTLSATGGKPDETAVRRNILFGDVWLCSGQSNMEMGVVMVNNSAQEIATADFPQIRLLSVPNKASTTPQQSLES